MKSELTNLRRVTQARKLKLLLKLLEQFAKSYLPRIRVRFRNDVAKMASGQSDLEKGIIYLSHRQEMNPDAVGLGLTYAYRIGPKYRKMKLSRYEMYFLTLLHEIGHFKIKERIPRKYVQLRKEILGDEPSYRMIELSYIESRLGRRAGERESAWKLRLVDFMSWLATGETISHHMRVEKWAIDEFERKRKFVEKMLLGAGLTAGS